MNRDDARQAIRRILNRKFSIVFKGHACFRATERRFNMQDIRWVIGSGHMVGEPRIHSLGFECSLRGSTLDGKFLKVPLIVDEKNSRIIVKSVVPQRRTRR
jgi:hypothetical protein